jgi:hypothetical protein
MKKSDIYFLETKLNRRLLKVRRRFNRNLIGGEKKKKSEPRRSSRKSKGVTKDKDPWFENRIFYEEEKKWVEPKKNETTFGGYGLFAKRDFFKGDIVIRMVEPVTAPTVSNTMARNRVPWTLAESGDNSVDFVIRRDGNQKCNKGKCKTCCNIVVGNAQYGTKFGKVRGKVTIKNNKRCRNLKEQYVDDSLFQMKSKKRKQCSVPLPNDAAIRDGDGSTVIYDNAFTDMNHIPLWYRINHSCRPNLEIRTTGQGGTGVKFMATRHIAEGEQLFFDYGVTPDEWNTGC